MKEPFLSQVKWGKLPALFKTIHFDANIMVFYGGKSLDKIIMEGNIVACQV